MVHVDNRSGHPFFKKNTVRKKLYITAMKIDKWDKQLCSQSYVLSAVCTKFLIIRENSHFHKNFTM